MKRTLMLCAGLAACTPAPEPVVPDPDPNLPFVRPYRADGDQCQLVGESPVTGAYLDDAADLVACPSEYEGLGVFVTDTNAQLVATYGAYTLFSVPVR